MLLGMWRAITRPTKEARRRTEMRRGRRLQRKIFKARIRGNIELTEKLILFTKRRLRAVAESIPHAQQKVLDVCCEIEAKIKKLISDVHPELAVNYPQLKCDSNRKKKMMGKENAPLLWKALDGIWNLEQRARFALYDTDESVAEINECIQELVEEKDHMKKWLLNVNRALRQRQSHLERIRNVYDVFLRAQDLVSNANLHVKKLQTGVALLIKCFLTDEEEDHSSVIAPSHC